MITMLERDGGQMLAISAPGVLSDTEDVQELRNALLEMLEMILYDEDLTAATPSNSLYIVANIIRELTRDIEKLLIEEGGAVC